MSNFRSRLSVLEPPEPSTAPVTPKPLSSVSRTSSGASLVLSPTSGVRKGLTPTDLVYIPSPVQTPPNVDLQLPAEIRSCTPNSLASSSLVSHVAEDLLDAESTELSSLADSTVASEVFQEDLDRDPASPLAPEADKDEDSNYYWSPWPEYGALIVYTFKCWKQATQAAISAMFKLRLYHWIFWPLGVYHVAAAWFHGYFNLAPRILPPSSESDERSYLERWVIVKRTPLDTDEELQPPVNRPRGQGVWLPRGKAKMALPRSQGGEGRGIGVTGLTTAEHWYMWTLVNLQILFFCHFRILQYVWNFGSWKKSSPTERDWNKETYKAFVNTAMCCWYQPDEYGDETKGSFTFYNMRYFWHNTQHLHAAKTQFFADHSTRTVSRLEITVADHPAGAFETPRPKLIVTEDPLEINQLAMHVAAVGTHANVHWWANGVNEVKQWPLAQRSSLWTQLFNWNALNGAQFFMSADEWNDDVILYKNMGQGLPMHFSIPDRVIDPDPSTGYEGAKLHLMNRKAKQRITEHFKSIGEPIDRDQLNSLMAATLLHSGDHFYLDKYCAVGGISRVLRSDLSAMRLTLVKGYKYFTPWFSRFRCVQEKDNDAVCKILYEVALEYEPEFAEGLLTIGIAI